MTLRSKERLKLKYGNVISSGARFGFLNCTREMINCLKFYKMQLFLKYNKSIHINHEPDATIFQFTILTFIYSLTCFGRFPTHHQEFSGCSSSLWFYLRVVVSVVLCSWSGRPARPRTQHDCHHDTKVKPEAATAVTELLMMGGKTPETCYAVNKRQDSELENC
jgi:hypothetical protein